MSDISPLERKKEGKKLFASG